ncbi:hypothetical protein [Mycobacterium sp. 236(2023)]|uniref:hypothetical protein n=1 Tax=Mycobacterium sp. 236(2023) TaxID=3038163 RepID=UPI0024154431|nr:hypothetical protein [Mycobacterium sp. 236(2023)]MDG4667338.1 hypothetical protein [Mycobacterium sp. 236(2023)]
MRESTQLFEPIVDIRDVLETFLADAIEVSGWQATLAAASAQLMKLGHEWSDDALLELGRETEKLAAEQSLNGSSLARAAAYNAARVLDEVRIAGVPRPDDDYWAF